MRRAFQEIAKSRVREFLTCRHPVAAETD